MMTTSLMAAILRYAPERALSGDLAVVAFEGAGRAGQGSPSGSQALAANPYGSVVELPLLVGEVDEKQLSVCHVDNYDDGV